MTMEHTGALAKFSRFVFAVLGPIRLASRAPAQALARRQSGELTRHLNRVLPNFGIATRLYIWTLAILMGAALVIGATTWYVADQQTLERGHQELHEALRGVQLELDRRTEAVEEIGQWLVQHQHLTQLIESRDGKGMTNLLRLLVKADIVDTIAVIDANSILLAQVPQDQTPSGDRSPLFQAGVRSALAGEISRNIEKLPSGTLARNLFLPLFERVQEPPVGVLVLSFEIDNNILVNAKNTEFADSVVLYGDQIVLSTILDAQGKLDTDLRIPASLLAAERSGLAARADLVDSQNRKYLFEFNPLSATRQSVVGMYGVGIAKAALDDERNQVVRTFALAVGFVFAGIVVLGYLAAVALTHPIRQLASAARKMAGSDFPLDVNLAGRDELGQLALYIERMHQELQRDLETTALEQRRFTALIQSLGVPTVITDPNKYILDVNPAAGELFKQNEADLVGQLWHNLFQVKENEGQSLPPFWRTGFAEGNAGLGPQMHSRFHLRARPQVVVDVVSTQIRVDGEIFGYVHCLADVSNLVEFVRSRDDFFVNIAHELEGPLSSWSAALELLLEDYLTLDARDLGAMLRHMHRTSVKLQVLIANLIDIGRLQAGRFKVYPVPVQLERITMDAVSQIEPLLRARGQNLEINLDGHGSAVVSADRTRVLQVLVNLLKNASKYSPLNQAITLSVCGDSGQFFFGVTDRGPGITLEDQGHLFERFFRGKRAEEEGAGVGLGLALAKGIVEAHGGHIGVSSTIGSGSTFWFSLPEAGILEV